MDASLSPVDKAVAAPVEKARTFFGSALQCNEAKYKSVGEGWDYRFEGQGSVGSALVVGESVIHMAFFTAGEETTKNGRMSPASRRRGYRI